MISLILLNRLLKIALVVFMKMLIAQQKIYTIVFVAIEWLALQRAIIIERYKNLILTARVDVGASTMWSESVVISTLNNLLEAQIITPRQFLERIPQGFVPKLTELIEDIRKQEEATTQVQDGKDRVLQQFAQQYPQEYAEYAKLSPEEQDKMLQQIIGGAAQ
jgi:hypothetical protein